MKVTILGCGGSGGVPQADGTPGGNWGACDPTNPKNRRRRVSILVAEAETTLLIDTSPDLRVQILDAQVEHLSAVLYTHAHADHCHGLDELRGLVYRQRGAIDAYMSAATQGALKQRFGYAFTSSAAEGAFYRPLLRDHVFDGPFHLGPFTIQPFEQGHGGAETTTGFRIGDMAYSTDVVRLEAAALSLLKGVKLWIVDCLRDEPHPTHSHVAQTFEWIAQVGPERAILTHMNHQIDYQDLRRRCPPGTEPAYDGMVIDL